MRGEKCVRGFVKAMLVCRVHMFARQTHLTSAQHTILPTQSKSLPLSGLTFRKVSLVCLVLISSTACGSMAHSMVSWPLRAQWMARAVPQAPAPMTVTLVSSSEMGWTDMVLQYLRGPWICSVRASLTNKGCSTAARAKHMTPGSRETARPHPRHRGALRVGIGYWISQQELRHVASEQTGSSIGSGTVTSSARRGRTRRNWWTTRIAGKPRPKTQENRVFGAI